MALMTGCPLYLTILLQSHLHIKILMGVHLKMLFDSGSESIILSKNLLDSLSIDYVMKHCKHQLSGVEGNDLSWEKSSSI